MCTHACTFGISLYALYFNKDFKSTVIYFVHVWKWWVRIQPLSHLGFGAQTQIVRFDGQGIYPMGNLTGLLYLGL